MSATQGSHGHRGPRSPGGNRSSGRLSSWRGPGTSRGTATAHRTEDSGARLPPPCCAGGHGPGWTASLGHRGPGHGCRPAHAPGRDQHLPVEAGRLWPQQHHCPSLGRCVPHAERPPGRQLASECINHFFRKLFDLIHPPLLPYRAELRTLRVAAEDGRE